MFWNTRSGSFQFFYSCGKLETEFEKILWDWGRQHWTSFNLSRFYMNRKEFVGLGYRILVFPLEYLVSNVFLKKNDIFWGVEFKRIEYRSISLQKIIFKISSNNLFGSSFVRLRFTLSYLPTEKKNIVKGPNNIIILNSNIKRGGAGAL